MLQRFQINAFQHRRTDRPSLQCKRYGKWNLSVYYVQCMHLALRVYHSVMAIQIARRYSATHILAICNIPLIDSLIRRSYSYTPAIYLIELAGWLQRRSERNRYQRNDIKTAGERRKTTAKTKAAQKKRN